MNQDDTASPKRTEQLEHTHEPRGRLISYEIFLRFQGMIMVFSGIALFAIYVVVMLQVVGVIPPSDFFRPTMEVGIFSFLILVLGLAEFITGIRLVRLSEYARKPAIWLGVIHLLMFPVGTLMTLFLLFILSLKGSALPP